MKKLMFVLIVLTQLAIAAPGYTFFDWLLSGGASRDAIDNSALGDLRAWWTGNPGYQFNPWWSGPSNPGAQGMTPGAGSYGPQAPYPQMPQPSISYSPPQGSPAGYGQPMPQTMQPGTARAGSSIRWLLRAISPCPNIRQLHRHISRPHNINLCRRRTNLRLRVIRLPLK